VKLVAALLYAVAVSALVSVASAFLLGGLRPAPALTAGGAVAAFALWQQRREPLRVRPLVMWEWAALIAFALFALRAFLWLVFTDGDRIAVLSPNNLGDLSLHITYIRYLANGAPFWPENPIYAGRPLAYPIGVDLFNALLTLVGVDVWRGLIWAGLGGAALAVAALWRWGGAFAVAGFLANGGLMGFAFVATGRLRDFQSDMAWKSLPLALFVTQRGLLWALPAGLLLMASWRARWSGQDGEWRLPWWGEWLLYAAMPLFHLHTFLFLSLLLAAQWVMLPSARRAIARLVAAALVPSSLLSWLVTGGFHGASMFGVKLGWMWDDPAWVEWCAAHLPGPPLANAALLFWPMNFGLLPVLVGLVCLRGRRSSRAFVFPAVGVFFLCCFVKFAPWEWDNTKLMLWSYLAVLPALWEMIGRWRASMRIAVCIALFWSGFASLLGGLDATHTGYDIAQRSTLDGVAGAVRAIPVTECFAGYPTFNHPLLLAGRRMAMGYTGHAWSHGIPWVVRNEQVEALMNGAEGWHAIAAALGVRYVFWGAQEIEHYPDSTQPWRNSARCVASGDWGEIYDLK
jgi:hypothetical protein